MAQRFTELDVAVLAEAEQRPNAPNLPMAEMNFIGLRRHRDRMNGKRVMYVRDQDGVEAMKIVRS